MYEWTILLTSIFLKHMVNWNGVAFSTICVIKVWEYHFNCYLIYVFRWTYILLECFLYKRLSKLSTKILNKVSFQLILILDHVKRSLEEMVSFDPKDVIFLLNKWDTFLEDDDRKGFFEDINKELCSIWENVNPTRILKFSINKVCTKIMHLFSCWNPF